MPGAVTDVVVATIGGRQNPDRLLEPTSTMTSSGTALATVAGLLLISVYGAVGARETRTAAEPL